MTTHASETTGFRRTGIVLGLLVFLLGIGLLGSVFATASAFFNLPPPALPAVTATPPPTPTPTPAVTVSKTKGDGATQTTVTTTSTDPATSPALVMGQSLAHFLQKLLILFLMCVAGSLIAGRGIEMFFRSLNAVTHSVAPPQSSPSPNP